jgi:SPP1 gp7 family putative phage head morphogenesis protein
MAKRKTRPPLTKTRQQWAEQRNGATFKGLPLHYNAAVESRYRESIQRLVELMAKAYARELKAVFTEHGEHLTQDASIASQARIRLNKLYDRFYKRFAKEAPSIVDRFFGGVDKASAASLGMSLKELSGGITLKANVMPAALQEAVTAATAENVALIKSIPEQYFTQIQGAVMRSIQPGGNGLADVAEALQKYDSMSMGRAKLIARDQTRKVTTAMNTERAKALGIRKFEWIHSGGGAEPRKEHQRMDGKIFSYDDPPVIDHKTGERGFPGQLINCRCVARPVVDFGTE